VISDCTFTNNTATDSGGAIANRPDGKLTVINCNFFYNSATGQANGEGVGGAIAALATSRTTTILGCTFSENQALTQGGAIYAKINISLTIAGSTISKNKTTGNNAAVNYGGGVFVYGVGWADITDTNINENETNGYGGGLAVFYCDLTMTNGQLFKNTSALNGGGFYADAQTVTFNQVSVTQNKSTGGTGGGGYLAAGTITGTLVALLGNTDTGGAPGIAALVGSQFQNLVVRPNQQTVQQVQP
jgi:predicted outer membrane repeat protein